MCLNRDFNEVKENLGEDLEEYYFRKKGASLILKKSSTKNTMLGAGKSRCRRRGDQTGRTWVIQVVRNQGIVSLINWLKLI